MTRYKHLQNQYNCAIGIIAFIVHYETEQLKCAFLFAAVGLSEDYY